MPVKPLVTQLAQVMLGFALDCGDMSRPLQRREGAPLGNVRLSMPKDQQASKIGRAAEGNGACHAEGMREATGQRTFQTAQTADASVEPDERYLDEWQAEGERDWNQSPSYSWDSHEAPANAFNPEGEGKGGRKKGNTKQEGHPTSSFRKESATPLRVRTQL